MINPRPYGILLCLALLTGCVGEPFQPSANLTEQVQRCLVPVVDSENRRRGLAVVVRATSERVLLAMAEPASGARDLYLAFAEERVPTNVSLLGELLLLEAARADRDLRAVQPAKRPQIGEFVFVYTAPPNRGIVRGLTSVSQATAERLHLLSAPPAEDDDRSTPQLVADARGGFVFAPSGALVGMLGDDPSGEEPDVRSLFDLAPGLTERLEMLPGAELMGPEDGFLTHLILVPELDPSQLPPIVDSWGDPDFFLLLERNERLLARLEITPQRTEPEPQLVWLSHRRGLSARLVERDITLTEGDTERSMAKAVPVEAKPSLECAFEIRPEVLATYPDGVVEPKETRVTVAFEEVDPERASGFDKTPLGAGSHGLGRVASGTVDWWGGDATDYWTIDAEQGGPVMLFLYRDRHDANIALQAFVPGVGQPLFTTDAGSDRRLLVAGGEVPAGQLLVRVRQLGGPRGESAYSLFLFPPAEGPEALFRALFRLLGRQSPSAFAFLASKEFAEQVRLALAELGFPRRAISSAVLAGLGDRMSAARHLALHLLDVHFRPSLTQLEAVRRKAVTADQRRGVRNPGRRARDAALLLALRCSKPRAFKAYVRILLARDGLDPGVLDPSSPAYDAARATQVRMQARNTMLKAVLDAARDVGDASIRLRGLAAASRWSGIEPDFKRQLRRELRAILKNDPSIMVRRGLERAFPPEVEERQRRLRQRAGRRVR